MNRFTLRATTVLVATIVGAGGAIHADAATTSAAAIAPPGTITVTPPTQLAPPAPLRAAKPAPPTRQYVPPVLIPTASITTSSVNGSGGVSFAVRSLAKPVAAGAIVVATPPGRHQLVGRVISVLRSGTSTVIATKPVSAMAALAPGSYVGSQDLAGATLTEPGGTVVHPRVTDSTTLDFPLTEKYSCGTGSVTLTADLSLTPSITADVSVGWFSLNSAKFIAGVNEQATITVQSSSPSGATSCSDTASLGSFDVPLDIGPIVADVTFGVTANLSAKLNGTVTATVKQSFSGQAGVQYDGNTWSIIDTASDGISHSVSVSGSNNVSVGLTVAAGVSLYDILSANLNLTASAGVETNPVPGPTWDLYAAVDLNADLKVFGYTVWHDDLWNHKWILFETPIITTAALPLEHPGVAFTFALTGAGGYGSHTYTLIPATEIVLNRSGAITTKIVPAPSWLHVSSAGVLSGTVPAGTADSSFPVDVEITDSLGLTGSHPYGLPIGTLAVSTPSITITPRTTSTPHLGAIDVSGTARWSVLSGSLPKGLTVATSGAVTGTPTPGTSGTFVAEVSDSTGAHATGRVTVTIPNVTCTPMKPGQPGTCR